MLLYTLINGKGCLGHRVFIFLFCLQIYKENFQKLSSGHPSEHSCNVITRYILGKGEHGKKKIAVMMVFKQCILYSRKKVITKRLAQIIIHEFSELVNKLLCKCS